MDALSVLMRIGSGKTLERLAAALAEVSEEVIRTGQPGAVSLKLKVIPQEKDEPMVLIADEIQRTPPKQPGAGAFFFSVDGELYREDPRQERMTFRAVDETTGEIREPAGREHVEREAR